jgi:hypothetical protein
LHTLENLEAPIDKKLITKGVFSKPIWDDEGLGLIREGARDSYGNLHAKITQSESTLVNTSTL